MRILSRPWRRPPWRRSSHRLGWPTPARRSTRERTTSPLVFDYTFDGNALGLSNLQGEHRECVQRVVWTTRPWVKS
jgi:hypothetical protein